MNILIMFIIGVSKTSFCLLTPPGANPPQPPKLDPGFDSRVRWPTVLRKRFEVAWLVCRLPCLEHIRASKNYTKVLA